MHSGAYKAPVWSLLSRCGKALGQMLGSATSWGRGSSDPATYTLCNLRKRKEVLALSGPLSPPIKQVPIVSDPPAPFPSVP